MENLDNIKVTVIEKNACTVTASSVMVGLPTLVGPAGPQGPQGPAGPSGGVWGEIEGTLSDQTDLQDALDLKANTADLGEMAEVDDAPSDSKEYVRKNGTWSEASGGGGAWGEITGTLSNQTDLQSALDEKIEDAPSDGKSYNRSDGDWVEASSGGYELLTYYVDPNGNDTNDGLTDQTPFATFQHAVDVASEVGITNIQLATGTYDETVTITGKKIKLFIHNESNCGQTLLKTLTVEDGGYLFVSGTITSSSPDKFYIYGGLSILRLSFAYISVIHLSDATLIVKFSSICYISTIYSNITTNPKNSVYVTNGGLLCAVNLRITNSYNHAVMAETGGIITGYQIYGDINYYTSDGGQIFLWNDFPATIAQQFSPGTAYSAGDYVMYQNSLYKFTANHPAGAWASADVTHVVAMDEVDGKQDTLTFDTTPTASSTNPVTSGGIKTALDAKQNTLSWDTAPTSGGTNPMTSGAIYAHEPFQVTGTASAGSSVTFTDSRIDSDHWRIPKGGIYFGTGANVTTGVHWVTNPTNHTVTLEATFSGATTVAIDMIWFQ